MISVIIPVYNVSSYLTECLNSVLNAASLCEETIECICIDDGSTDDSAGILDDYAAMNPTIIVCHQDNLGVAAARNAGLRRARGDWLMFLDADDLLRESFFKDLHSAIKMHSDADLIGFGITPFYTEHVDWPISQLSFNDIRIDIELCDTLASMSFVQFAYRRSEHGKAEFLRLKVGEDLVFVAEAFSRSRKCVVTTKVEYGYRFRCESATHAGVTIEKLHDTVEFNTAVFGALSRSNKRIGARFSLGRGNEWIERLPKEILRHRHENGFAQLWCKWLDSMEKASHMSSLLPWQRFVAGNVARIHSKFAVSVLCLFPSWLSRKGILRRGF